MSVNGTIGLVMENSTNSNDMWILYKPKSDFINLSKLSHLELAKKLEAMNKEESNNRERTPTLERWVWENMVGVIDILLCNMKRSLEVNLESDGDVSLKASREKYIMGILSERVSITCTVAETLGSLSEEEWDFVCEAPEEDPRRIMWWSPDEDPRPRWLVQREKD